MRRVRNLILLLLLILSPALSRVYEIAEPDLLEEIEAGIEVFRKNMEKIRKEFKNRIENFTGEVLPFAEKDRKYSVDPSYCLEKDIYYREEGEWKILYPKGYCFNPIDYLPYTPPPMVVFNPCRKEEREYVEKQYRNREVIFVSTGCPIKRVRKLGLKTYFLTKEIKDRFRLKETISIISVNKEKALIEVEVRAIGNIGR